jgi:hypothetical protein
VGGTNLHGNQEATNVSTTFATDGSMYPPWAKPGQHRIVSASCVTENGEITAVIPGGTCQVMHRELLGVITAFIQGRREKREGISILSDYLPAVRKIWDHVSRKKQMENAIQGDIDRFAIGGSGMEAEKLELGAGRSWYGWMFDLWMTWRLWVRNSDSIM